MFDRTRIGCGCPASICLDCGTDECPCDAGDLEVSERGMRFKSPWQFSLGSQLAVAMDRCGEDGKTVRVKAEGLVVDCEEIAPSRFHVTVLFLELSNDSQEAIANISHQLDVEMDEQAGFTA